MIQKLAQTIRGLRVAAGLTQADLAALAGISIPALAKLEHGGGGTSLAILSKVAAALGAEIHIVAPTSAPLPTRGLPRGRRR